VKGYLGLQVASLYKDFPGLSQARKLISTRTPSIHKKTECNTIFSVLYGHTELGGEERRKA